MARLEVLVSLFNRSGAVNSTSDWIIRVEQPIAVVPESPREHRYTPVVDEAVARSLRVSLQPDGSAADGLRWDGHFVKLTLWCDAAPADLFTQVGIGMGTRGFVLGNAYWTKGKGGRREFKVAFKEVGELAAGKPVNVTLIGDPSNANATFAKGDWWLGTVRFAGITLIDETAAGAGAADGGAPPAVPELQVHRPGTRVRPYGYFPVTDDSPATREAVGAGSGDVD
jgi:hypothetical protein